MLPAGVLTNSMPPPWFIVAGLLDPTDPRYRRLSLENATTVELRRLRAFAIQKEIQLSKQLLHDYNLINRLPNQPSVAEFYDRWKHLPWFVREYSNILDPTEDILNIHDLLDMDDVPIRPPVSILPTVPTRRSTMA